MAWDKLTGGLTAVFGGCVVCIWLVAADNSSEPLGSMAVDNACSSEKLIVPDNRKSCLDTVKDETAKYVTLVYGADPARHPEACVGVDSLPDAMQCAVTAHLQAVEDEKQRHALKTVYGMKSGISGTVDNGMDLIYSIDSARGRQLGFTQREVVKKSFALWGQERNEFYSGLYRRIFERDI